MIYYFLLEWADFRDLFLVRHLLEDYLKFLSADLAQKKTNLESSMLRGQQQAVLLLIGTFFDTTNQFDETV